MKWIALLGWFGLCYSVAAVGGWWTAGELRDWYLSLKRPSFAPPNWVFGPVWTVLYALMAIAVWLVWLLPPSPQRNKALLLFIVQLALNLLWTWLFFHEHDIANALADVILLWIAIAAVLLLVGPILPVAAWLLAPYWAWITFAMILNYGFWRLNPDSD